jgi:hypothetical protein
MNSKRIDALGEDHDDPEYARLCERAKPRR